MRIAYFSDTFLPNINGIVTSIANSSKALAAKGHTVKIFTSKIKGDDKVRLGKGVSVDRFSAIKMKKWDVFYQFPVPFVIDLFSKIRKFNPDIIHIHTPSIIGGQALMYAKLFNVPVVVTYHTLMEDFGNHLPFSKISNNEVTKKIAHYYSRAFHDICGTIVSPSNIIKEYLVKKGFKSDIVVISNGVDTSLFYPGKSKKKGKTIIHVGRLCKEKNVDVLIKAFATAAKQIPELRLIVAGPGDIEGLKRLAKKIGISDKITFSGKITHEKLPELYNKADLFVTASTVETEGLVVLEAMACGLPVVGVKAMALTNLIKQNYNGFLANPGNERELADHIVKTISNADLINKLGKNALITVKNYSFGESIKKVETLYKKLVNN